MLMRLVKTLLNLFKSSLCRFHLKYPGVHDIVTLFLGPIFVGGHIWCILGYTGAEYIGEATCVLAIVAVFRLHCVNSIEQCID